MMSVNLTNKQKGSAAAFIAAVLTGVLAVEGGYVNDPRDPGGETNHGVTKAVATKHQESLKQQGWDGTMRGLNKDHALSIYYKDYVQKPGYDQIVPLSPAVAEKLIDIGVNAGPHRSSLWFQESLNAVSGNGKDYTKITLDGKVGAGTVSAYKALQQKRGKVTACKMVLKMLDAKQANHYLNLKMHTFTAGWVINRVGNVPLERCNVSITN